MKVRAIMAAAVLALTACGPLSAMSKVSDASLDTLELCCEQRLRRGLDVYSCEHAFQKHDEFVQSWEIAKASGSDELMNMAALKLAEFQQAAMVACVEE